MTRAQAKAISLNSANRMEPINRGLYDAVVAACRLINRNQVMKPAQKMPSGVPDGDHGRTRERCCNWRTEG